MKFSSPPLSWRRRAARSRRRAATLVEAALCLIVILLPLTLGGFQFALFFMTQHSLQQVTRESVRWAAVHYSEDTFNGPVTQGDAVTTDGVTTKGPPSLLHYIRDQAAAQGIGWKEISGAKLTKGSKGGSVVVTPAAASRRSGKPLTITITYPMRQRSFLGNLFFKADDTKLSTVNLGFLKSDYSASATMLLE